MGKYDLVADRDNPGKLYSPYCLGGFVGVQYNINPSVFCSATFGGTRYLPKYKLQPDAYKGGALHGRKRLLVSHAAHIMRSRN